MHRRLGAGRKQCCMPTRRPLQSGDTILIEAEGRWGRYITQNTQPVFVDNGSLVRFVG